MVIRSTVKNGPAVHGVAGHWQAEKLRQIEQIHLDNPQPKVISLETGTGNAIALIDESNNLAGSHKLWLALEIIRHKLRGNALKAGMTVVQRASGSMATAMAFACQRLGLPYAAIVPHDLSAAVRSDIERLGGRMVPSRNAADAHDIEAGFMIRPGFTVIDQYSAEVRALPTPFSPGERMLKTLSVAVGQMPSVVVTAVGTGTTANTVRFAASDRQLPLDIVGTDVAGGILTDFVGLNLHGRCDKPHCLEGASPGYVPPSFIRTSIDRFHEVHQEAAIAVCHLMKEQFDFAMGPTSGMALYGALIELQRMKERNKGALVATFCYDHGDRYADTIYNEDFLRAKNLDMTRWRGEVERLVTDLQ